VAENNRGFLCHDPLLVDVFNRLLEGFVDDMLIDVPVGALLSQDVRNKVVITSATGSLYLSDLMEQKPRALIAGCRSFDELLGILENLKDKWDREQSVNYYGPGLDASVLTKSERKLLRLYLESGSVDEVAKRMAIKKKTAFNRLSLIKDKLQAKNYKELMEAYFYRSDF